MSQQIMITITDTLVKLIIMILKAKENIREVEYFDLELECLHRIMWKNQIFTRQVVRNLSITMIPLSATGVKRKNVTQAGRRRMPGERIVEHLSERAPTDAGNQDKNAVKHLSAWTLTAASTCSFYRVSKFGKF